LGEKGEFQVRGMLTGNKQIGLVVLKAKRRLVSGNSLTCQKKNSDLPPSKICGAESMKKGAKKKAIGKKKKRGRNSFGAHPNSRGQEKLKMRH